MTGRLSLFKETASAIGSSCSSAPKYSTRSIACNSALRMPNWVRALVSSTPAEQSQNLATRITIDLLTFCDIAASQARQKDVCSLVLSRLKLCHLVDSRVQHAMENFSEKIESLRRDGEITIAAEAA
jgi:hypothetical protein